MINWANNKKITYVESTDEQMQRVAEIKANPQLTLREAQPVWGRVVTKRNQS